MKRWLWASTLMLLMAAPAFADAIYYAPQVTGARERSNIRHYLFVKNLTGDKRAVYDDLGYTAHRVRLNEYGVMREQWTYYEYGKVFVFDQCSNLVEEHNISVEHRRAWQYQENTHGYYEPSVCNDD